VTIAVTWQGAEAGPVFNVALDTHSVDLDAVDLSKAAMLRTDPGVQVRPVGWDAPKGGHHRSGTLAFPTTAHNMWSRHSSVSPECTRHVSISQPEL
jgi:hypothetical protein